MPPPTVVPTYYPPMTPPMQVVISPNPERIDTTNS